jgi:hypothetical protein
LQQQEEELKRARQLSEFAKVSEKKEVCEHAQALSVVDDLQKRPHRAISRSS